MDRQELSEKLNRDVPTIAGREVWIWGAGHTARTYQEGLKRIDKFTICGYCDNDSEKWGGYLSGKPIISPEELRRQGNICVLICTPQEKVVTEVGRQLEQSGIEWYRLDETILKLYRAEVLQCYDLLDDQLSKDTYAHIINCHMTNHMPDDDYISENQYFAIRPFRAYGKETFVDCGAFAGDTIEQYIWRKYAVFHKIIAFEPDKGNFRAMTKRVARLREEWNLSEYKIAMHCCAVGEKSDVISIAENGSISSIMGEFIDPGEEDVCKSEVKVISLDAFLKEPYSFLKADIEGYEYNMILGAQRGIRDHKPLIAICIYHNAMDLFQLQLLLHQLVPEYQFAVRHHSITFDETILYAYLN